MSTNSVVALRDREIQKVTRPFAARGSSLKRCASCMLSERHCICNLRPSVNSSCAMCFIYYQGEVFKPSNTGRIVADVVTDNYAFQWQRTELDPQLEALLENPAYVPVVVFPHEYADQHQRIHHLDELGDIKGRKPLYILLDGTWREAKKMFRSAYLNSLPVLGLQPSSASEYHLRESAHLHQLCTAEVGIEVLNIQGDRDVAAALNQYFQTFRQRYLADKANIRLDTGLP